MLDDRASSSSPAFLACMLQMPITFFPLVPTPQSAIKGYKEKTWEPREEFLETEALAQFERKFGTGNGVGEEDSGPTTGPRPRRQGGRRTLIDSLYFLEGTRTPPNSGQ
jgi:hypothetical protein